MWIGSGVDKGSELTQITPSLACSVLRRPGVFAYFSPRVASSANIRAWLGSYVALHSSQALEISYHVVPVSRSVVISHRRIGEQYTVARIPIGKLPIPIATRG